MADKNTNFIGYYEGILDLYYAIMESEDSTAAAPTYGKPKVLAKSIEVTITPRYREGKLYASNAAVRNERRIDGYDISCNVDQIVSAVRREILGRKTDRNGVEIITGSQIPPYVALGFAQTLDNDSKELWWLLKGKFAESEKSGKTRNENIEYQTPTITGSFDRRIFDDSLASIVNSDDDGLDPSVVSGWFDAVYEPNYNPKPEDTLTVEPMDAAAQAYGMTVSELQQDIQITGNKVSGTLHYKKGYTGFSEADNDGNFLAMTMDYPEDAEVKLTVIGGSTKDKPVEKGDKLLVVRVKDAASQKVQLDITVNGESGQAIYDLSGLTLESDGD